MKRVGTRSMVSIAATLALLTIAGARSLHFEMGSHPRPILRSATVAPTGPCSLCDQPDCALVPTPIRVAAPVTRAVISIRVDQAPTGNRHRFPYHVRPPPGA